MHIKLVLECVLFAANIAGTPLWERSWARIVGERLDEGNYLFVSMITCLEIFFIPLFYQESCL